MSGGIAYSSSAPEVVTAWDAWRDHMAEVRAARDEMSARYGRHLLVNHAGFGHGTRVTGFEGFDDDEPGALIGGGGELRVPLRRTYPRTVNPNFRRKAGKELAAELTTLTEKGPDLPGMPGWTLVGLRVLAPAMFAHEGHVWAMWSDDVSDNGTGGRIDGDTLWTPKPLSAYYAAHEAMEAATS